MLARDRGDHADVEAAVARPIQREPVRRRLHDDAVVAILDHPRQQLLELERLRRRGSVVVRAHVIADADEDGTDLAGTAAGAAKELGGQCGHGRLAVGARHADDGQPLRRPSEPRVGGIGQGTSGAVDNQLRDRQPGELALDDEADGTRLHRRGGEVMAVDVDPGDGEEERARLDATRVVRQRGHLADRDAHDALWTDRVGEGTEAHPTLVAHRRTRPIQRRRMPVAARMRYSVGSTTRSQLPAQ